MYQSTVSVQGQTTIPVQIRDELGLTSGAQMVWDSVQDKLGIKYIRITPVSTMTLKSLRGIGREMYKKYGGGRKHLAKERAAWDKNLSRHQSVYCLFEGESGISQKVEDLLVTSKDNRLRIISSPLTITELLIIPLKDENLHLIEVYKSLKSHINNIDFIDFSFDISITAANLRSKYNLSIQIVFIWQLQ